MYNFEWNTFTIVEIKYCRDTDRETQRAKATKQHKHLCQSIAGQDNQEDTLVDLQDTGMQELGDALSGAGICSPSVSQVTILLGVTGVIYEETERQLTQLGVSGPALKKLMSDLHYTAISGLERIWRQRGALLKQLGHLRMANYSRGKKVLAKRAFKAPWHRKHVKRKRQQ
eukprot:GHRQ01009960.1.p1 GENE.GHRQ01009960.1~~GHRQ01009960.1.p1  ORF type:complete len:171 (-),score=2.33 GHRQ01009960.1:104-616(-)